MREQQAAPSEPWCAVTKHAMDYESAFDLALSEAAHLPPDEKMTVAEAHRAVRRHRDCNRDRFPMKAEAVQVLCDAGHMQHADTYDRVKRR